MDIAYELAKHIVKTKYEDLPKEAIESTKRFVLDTLGCAMAGSSVPGVDAVVNLVKHWGGRRESTIMVYGGKAPADSVALVNGLMCRVLDYCETHLEAFSHSFSGVLPAALAVAEERGEISGKDLITALAVGTDIHLRIGISVRDSVSGFVPAGVHSYFGAAAAAAKLFGFDEEKTLNTLGLAYEQAAATWQPHHDSAFAFRMENGFGARGGVLSAYLADRDISGPKNIFDGVHGYFNVYERGQANRKNLLRNLGKTFEIVNSEIKPYPSCRGTHPLIDALLEMVPDNDIKPEDVDEVIVTAPPFFYNLLGRPYEVQGTVADSRVLANFCYPYPGAVAILRGHVALDDFDEQSLKDTTIVNFSKKVKTVLNQSIKDVKALVPVTVDIRLKNGKTNSKTVNVLKGNPKKPLSQEELLGKFGDCARHAAKPIRKQNLEKLIDSCLNLEKMDNVSQMTGLTFGR